MLFAAPGGPRQEPLLYCSPVCHSTIKGCEEGHKCRECGSREQPAGCLRPAGLPESVTLSLSPGWPSSLESGLRTDAQQRGVRGP